MRRALLSSALALLLAAAPLSADDAEPQPAAPATPAAEPAPGAARPTAPEVWHFRKGEAERSVDVTTLPEVVREAIQARMAVDGYLRVAGPARGRDLEADARELVARGGRFPGRVRDAAPSVLDPEPARPRVQGILLGAPVRLESAAGAAWLRVLGAPTGSLAQALGLVRGDRIVALDGAQPTPALLTRCRGVELAPGQLALRVLRREGRTETWTLTFSRGAPPASR